MRRKGLGSLFRGIKPKSLPGGTSKQDRARYKSSLGTHRKKRQNSFLDVIGWHWDNLYRKQPTRQGSFVWSESPSSFITSLIPQLKSEGHRTILDVGCGDGRNLKPFLDAGFNVAGVDASREALSKAKINLAGSSPQNTNVTLYKKSLQGIKLGSTFDVLISTKVFKHLWETESIVKNLLTHLNPKGVLVFEFATPNDSSYKKCSTSGKRIGKNKFSFSDGTHYRFYEKEELEEMFKGCTEVQIQKVEYEDEPHTVLSKGKHRHESWVVIATK